MRKTQTSTSLIEGSFAMKKPSDWHHPRCSGLRVQGTAISPDSTAFKNTDCSGVAFIIDEFVRAVNRKSAPSLPAHAKGHIAPRAQDSARKPCGRRKGQNGKSRAQSAPSAPARAPRLLHRSPGFSPPAAVVFPLRKKPPLSFSESPFPALFQKFLQPPFTCGSQCDKIAPVG